MQQRVPTCFENFAYPEEMGIFYYVELQSYKKRGGLATPDRQKTSLNEKDPQL